MMEPVSTSDTWSIETVSLSNSSGMRVMVAPAALPMPSARWPACLPMVVMKYHLPVVRASSMRFVTMRTPSCLAVS